MNNARTNEIGTYCGFKIVSDSNLIIKEGYEYKKIPRWNICCLRWIKKTVKIDRLIPSDIVHIDNKNMIVYMHPHLVEYFKKKE